MQDEKMDIKKEVFVTAVVYGKPSCRQCDATKRKLDASNKNYEYIDITLQPEALATIKELGYLQAPVVVTDEKHWSGYRPDYLDLYVP